MAMLTQAQLQAVQASVRAVGMDYEAMAMAVDLAMFQAGPGAADFDYPYQSASSDGTSLTRMPMADGIMLATYFRQRACGGHISQPLEFNRY